MNAHEAKGSITAPQEYVFGRSVSVFGWHLLRIGLALFVVSSVFLYLTHGNVYRPLVFGAFVLTHLVNMFAFFFLMRSVWLLSRSFWYRLWLGVLSIPVVLFVGLSLPDFFSFAVVNFLRLPHPLNNELIGLLSLVSGKVVMSTSISVITYLYVLPLQAIVFLCLLLTIGVLFMYRKRMARPIIFPHGLISGLIVFFVMALFAVGDLLFVLT